MSKPEVRTLSDITRLERAYEEKLVALRELRAAVEKVAQAGISVGATPVFHPAPAPEQEYRPQSVPVVRQKVGTGNPNISPYGPLMRPGTLQERLFRILVQSKGARSRASLVTRFATGGRPSGSIDGTLNALKKYGLVTQPRPHMWEATARAREQMSAGPVRRGRAGARGLAHKLRTDPAFAEQFRRDSSERARAMWARRKAANGAPVQQKATEPETPKMETIYRDTDHLTRPVE